VQAPGVTSANSAVSSSAGPCNDKGRTPTAALAASMTGPSSHNTRGSLAVLVTTSTAVIECYWV
jgi:hypothetical protein